MGFLSVASVVSFIQVSRLNVLYAFLICYVLSESHLPRSDHPNNISRKDKWTVR
jgi:hypothetical protein